MYIDDILLINNPIFANWILLIYLQRTRDKRSNFLYLTSYPSGALAIYGGVRVTRSLFFSVMFCRSLFVLFLLIIVLSVLLRFTASEFYPFGIFKLFLFFLNLHQIWHQCSIFVPNFMTKETTSILSYIFQTLILVIYQPAPLVTQVVLLLL